MSALIFFVVIWVLFALWSRRQKLTGVMAWGGGFIVACLALIPILLGGKYLDEKYGPASAQKIEQSAGTQARGLGVSYSQLIEALGPYAPDLKPAPTTDGSSRLLGRTQGGSTAVIEVSGKALSQSVDKATLSIAISTNDKQNGVNAQLLERYMAVLFPDWSGRNEWATKAIQAGQKETVNRADKRITFLPVGQMQMLMFTAEAI